MSETCETVVIETDNGPVDINKTDFDEKIHKLADQKPEPEPEKTKSVGKKGK